MVIARFGQFMKDQLMPEDPLDWIILLLVFSIIVGAVIVVIVMFSTGLI
ncbi:MAG: hypothetical protein H6753_05470 [Candidatus Omnitrophica bacterium]|nr:hypothetical protein [Candidatus Omnitrophota bacterium]